MDLLPKYKIIVYYENKKDLLKALVDYNENPSISNKSIIILNISRSHVLDYRAAYKVWNNIYDMIFNDIKTLHLQNILDTCGKNYHTLRKLKCYLINYMLML